MNSKIVVEMFEGAKFEEKTHGSSRHTVLLHWEMLFNMFKFWI